MSPGSVGKLEMKGWTVKKRREKGYTISAVAESYDIHPQTLRLYERQGLLKPSRSKGNTRYYSESDLRRLELILTLTRDLGVNLAGVEVILNMRDKMDVMQKEIQRFLEYLRIEVGERMASQFAEKFAIVPFGRGSIMRSSLQGEIEADVTLPYTKPPRDGY
jgi:MerR family transcriptional regulator/heat shock protein HspR